MKTIAVTGGKGGTGKSTVAIGLAFRNLTEGKKVLLVDCDVECPNDHILLGIDNLRDPIKKTFTYYPKINKEKCIKCGLCVQRCPSAALFQPKNKIPKLKQDLCSSCGVCWTICPQKAIKKEKKQNGEIFNNTILENFTLITGRSIPQVRETSPVVNQVKNYIETFYNNFDFVIIDTAAGTHCTVMSALDGADKAIAVTEPTPLGAHDLDVILKVLKVLNIPSEIALNRSDVGKEKLIRDIADEHNTKITINIPYNKELEKHYSKGNLLKFKNRLSNLIKK